MKAKKRLKRTTNAPFIFYPITLCIFFLHYSGSNPCPSLHGHRSNPLRYRGLFLLSIELAIYKKILSRLFLLICMINEQKNHLQIRHVSMVVKAACLRIAKTCEDRSVVNHCFHVRLKFKILN